jgi:hypothetical protein
VLCTNLFDRCWHPPCFNVWEGVSYKTYEKYYHDGIQNGQHNAWYPHSNIPQYNGKWSEGAKSGEWNFYYLNGSKAITCVYSADQLNGQFTSYDLNGVMIASGKYIDGSKANGSFLKDHLDFLLEGISPSVATFEKEEYEGGNLLSSVKITMKDFPEPPRPSPAGQYYGR